MNLHQGPEQPQSLPCDELFLRTTEALVSPAVLELVPRP